MNRLHLRIRLWAVAALAVAATACGAPPDGTAGMQLRLQVPADAAGAFMPANTGATTLPTSLYVRVELWQDQGDRREWIAGETLIATAGRSEFEGLPPGTDYMVDVYAGNLGEGGNLGVIRYEGHAGDLVLPPDEAVEVPIRLELCQPRPELPGCNPDFSVRREPPTAPTIHPRPAQTSCADFVMTGTKPARSVLLDQQNSLIYGFLPADQERAYWFWNLQELFGGSGETSVSRQLKTAWADNRDIVSSSVNMQLAKRNTALCFNPYKETSATDSDIRRDGNDLVLRWRAGGRSLAVAAWTDASGNSPAVTRTDIPAEAVTAPASAGELRLPRPAGDAWDLWVYAEDLSDSWQHDGAFRYDESWISLERPDLQ